MNTPPIVSPEEWEAARQQLLVKEKELTRARDALAAERRRMPWLAVEKEYEFDGPEGKASLLDLFDGRRQLIVYRAFFEPGVHGWPEHACLGCSMVADQVAHVAHLNARDTTLAFASRAPQADIERVKARMGWEMPWYTITDGFDADFGVDEWHGTNAFIRDGDRVFRTYFINSRGDEAMGSTWSYLDMTALGRQEEWEDSPEGYPQTPPYEWWNWHDEYGETAPSEEWLSQVERGVESFRDVWRPRGAPPRRMAAPRDRPRRRRAGRGVPAAVGERGRAGCCWCSPGRCRASDVHAARGTTDHGMLTVGWSEHPEAGRCASASVGFKLEEYRLAVRGVHVGLPPVSLTFVDRLPRDPTTRDAEVLEGRNPVLVVRITEIGVSCGLRVHRCAESVGPLRYS